MEEVQIVIDFGDFTVDANLFHTPIAQKFAEHLPYEVSLMQWGEELYGDIPVSINPENTQVECEVGDIGYWLSGSGFCIFFGRTPVSTSDKPKAASDMNVFAHIEEDAKIFAQFHSFSGIVRKGN